MLSENFDVLHDALREGNVEKGEQSLHIMDEIYVELEAMDEAYACVGA